MYIIYNNAVKLKIRFSEEKDQLLLATRGVGFREVIIALNNHQLLANINHPNQQRSNQKMFVIKIDSYAYAVPYVLSQAKQEVFLKTIYKSRIFTKKYLKRKNEKK